MSDMVERLAKAVYLNHRGRTLMRPWESLDHFEQGFWKEAAVAGLKEIRSPTEAMLSAKHPEHGQYHGVEWYLDDWSAEDVWHAMIDAALASQNNGSNDDRTDT